MGVTREQAATVKSRAAYYESGGAIDIRDVELEGPQRGELLVRMEACGICPGETMRWYVDRKAPFGLGHEPVGVIEACGADAGPFGVGERVYVHHHAPCLACRRCLRGDHVQCATWRKTHLRPGGMATRAIVPAEIAGVDVLPLPDGVDDDTATFIEPLATVVKSVRRAGIRRGDRVLVIGLGVMGLLHLMLAQRAGAGLALGSDVVASRRERALGLGAHAFDAEGLAGKIAEATEGEGADIVIVGPGSVSAMDAAAACVAPGGTILLFTALPPGVAWPMPVHDLYFKDVSVVTSYSAGPDDTRDALRLLENGLPVKPLITHRYALSDAAEAYRAVSAAGEALKVIVYPQRA